MPADNSSKEAVQRTGPLDMEYATIEKAGDRDRLLTPWHGTGRLHECGAEITHTSHRPQDDAIRDPQKGVDAQQEVQTGKNTMACLEKHT